MLRPLESWYNSTQGRFKHIVFAPVKAVVVLVIQEVQVMAKVGVSTDRDNGVSISESSGSIYGNPEQTISRQRL